jgi:hypothetical protein
MIGMVNGGEGMIQYRTVKIPQPLYEKAEKLARQRQQKVNELISGVLDETFSFLEGEETFIDLSEPDEAVDREMEAYIAMHPMLWEKYPGQHVAVFGGELVDRDTDLNALYDRIDEHYPNDFVWITTVEADPIATVSTSSFRLSSFQ